MTDQADLLKAFAAKDYSKLVHKKITVNGKNGPYERNAWVLPDDPNQRNLYDEKTGGAESPTGDRGYFDHLDKETKRLFVDPLVKTMKGINPELANRLSYKYQNYPFDRDTKELDIKADFDMAWYMRKMRAEPEYHAEWQQEYNQKTDRMVKQINNRKAAMLRAKVGMQVNYYGKPSSLVKITPRGFPVVKTAEGEKTAMWEELA